MDNSRAFLDFRHKGTGENLREHAQQIVAPDPVYMRLYCPMYPDRKGPMAVEVDQSSPVVNHRQAQSRPTARNAE
jgi:hypothetical protein